MRVTDIEVHEITLEYHDWIAYPLDHYYGPPHRTIYIAHTDTGLTGLGEGHGLEPKEVLERYIGSNPFEWIGDETSLALGTAMYDLMGQAADVPVHKLFGQSYRSWVPMGSWTVSTRPSHMAEAVERYAAAGYTWMKYHLSPFENVFDQTEAMQKVAPPGFKIHYDFTMHGTNDHMPDLLTRLQEYPIAGCFEDPLPGEDLDGYIELRHRLRLPVVLHHFPTRATYEVFRRPADIYMLGHAKIGDAVRRAGLFSAGGAPFMLQNVGGAITRAMAVHMMAAFPTATFHCHNDTETWKSDVVHQRLDPINGLVRVPDKPGLGLTLDRDELERLAALSLPRQEKWIIKSRLSDGTLMYNLADPEDSGFMVRPDSRRLMPFSYDAPIQTEYWDNDGSPEYRHILERLEKEGLVLVSSTT
jgi:gluconate/galactonate dehydratase